MVFSNPHLMYADRKYGDFVEGLQPDPDLHSSFVVLEPVSLISYHFYSWKSCIYNPMKDYPISIRQSILNCKCVFM